MNDARLERIRRDAANHNKRKEEQDKAVLLGADADKRLLEESTRDNRQSINDCSKAIRRQTREEEAKDEPGCSVLFFLLALNQPFLFAEVHELQDTRMMLAKKRKVPTSSEQWVEKARGEVDEAIILTMPRRSQNEEKKIDELVAEKKTRMIWKTFAESRLFGEWTIKMLERC